jgi:sialate O-acetylesterase
MKKQLVYLICISFTLAGLYKDTVYAAVRLPAIFGDNMVLQSNIRVPVWGWADPGENVRIDFIGRTFKTKAGENGKWSLKLRSYAAGGPYQMVIKGNSGQLLFENILIGDVWVASGQSNMEFGLKNEKRGDEAVANARDSLIHLFTVPVATSLQPRQDIDASKADLLEGKWVVCSPENIVYYHAPWTGFSAVAYNFAVQIRSVTHAPVGMIGTYKGGTPAQAWMSLEGLQQTPELAKYIAAHQAFEDNFMAAGNAYPQKMAAYQVALDQWNNDYGKDYAAAVKTWEEARIKAGDGPVPPHPKPLKPAPLLPVPPDGGFGGPANLYNAMLNPVLHYGIKGVIWYQGENNGDSLPDAAAYKTLFPALIKDWRSRWQQGDFPFLFVQLANFRAPAKSPSEGNWPWVREGQLKALALPRTGMVVTTDLGDADNIHPTDKQDVALRLALVARHVVYHEHMIYSGPQYRSMKMEGNKVRLTFDENSTLIIGNGSNKENAVELRGFGIAGADHKFHWAKATIENNVLIVYSDEVEDPEAVRYNWADNPPGNLYNQAGLPASPFRTDNWSELLTVNN